SKEDTADDGLEKLFDQQVFKPYQIVEINGLRIGIFGILGHLATELAPMMDPVRFKDPVRTAREYVRLLKETEKADLVICISHSGISRDEDGGWTGEDAELALKVPDIDLIISGHTHILLEQPAIINGTPVLCTGSLGAGLGRYEMKFVDGHPSQVDARVIPVTNEISPDTLIQCLIAEQEGRVIDHILKPYHLLDTTTVVETSFPLVCNLDTMLEKSNLGHLISDAIYYHVNSHYLPGTDIAFFPAGLVSDNIMPRETGRQSFADLFRIAPLGSGKDSIPGYPLARAYVTGNELKGMMEILYMAPSFSRDFYLYAGGLRVTFDPHKGLFRKITSIEIGNTETGFVPVDFSKRNKNLYSVTANTYVLGFAGQIRKITKRLVSIDLKNESGELIGSVDNALLDAAPDEPGIQEVKEWMALIWFLQQQPDSNDNGIGDITDYYRTVSPRLFQK
ncbi:bifunctional metallophosphatase/5'-nucleotidase, partial [bacterium]|nr:bifunctional metallophosphatase/5'-nucleotidase [bacterium]